MKKKLLSIAQLLLGVGLVAWFLSRLDNTDRILEAYRTATGNTHWLALGILMFGVCLSFCILRWNLLLKAQGLTVPIRRVVSLYFVGQFFNSFMPGSVGGDIIKAYFVARCTHSKKTEAIATIMLDRVIGLLALLAMTAVIMMLALRFFLSTPETQVALAFNLGLLSVALIGLVLVFRKNIFEQWGLFRRLSERTAAGAMINRLYNAFHLCFRQSGLLTRAVLLSLANHLSLIVCAYFLARALEINLTLLNCLTIFPVINAIAAIPITPGGLGTREGATVFLLGAFGVANAPAIALSLLLYAVILGWSLVGGLVYATYLYGRDKSLAEAIRSAVEENAEADLP
jgi:glycosyltransferase 2 family protein